MTLRLAGTTRVVLAGLLIAFIGLVDWRVDAPIAFGFLYLFPILLVGSVLSRWQIVLTAVLCTALSDLFDPFTFTPSMSLPQDILVFSSLTGTGLFAFEVARSRKRELENLRRVEREAAARKEAEEQLEFLVANSPVAILTMTPGGTILQANGAAQRLFGTPKRDLRGGNIRRYIPALGRVSADEASPGAFRTEMQCRAERDNGEVFLANVFFSTYNTAVGPRLAALVVDVSEDLREREETNLEQLMAGSRILVGAVSHEVRNVCGAIGVVYENLARNGTFKGSKDYEALGALVQTLQKIASVELKQTQADSQIGGIDLSEVLAELRIVLEPFCEEAGIEVNWVVPERLPLVWADPHRLLQVLLNLTKNSERALEDAPLKRLTIEAFEGPGLVVSIRVRDTGPGLASPEHLFQPFQKGAQSTGLGLYISRAFVRSFRGELRYEPVSEGCSFVIELAVARPHNPGISPTYTHGNHTALIA